MSDHIPAPPPAGLAPGGLELWTSITEAHDIDAVQVVQLTEACRQKDRLDEMDLIIQGKGVLNLMKFRVGDIFHGEDEKRINVTVKFDSVIDRANATANAMKQLLAALRLPDDAGRVPQRRGTPRGSVAPQQPGGKVASLDRARARKSG